MGKAPARNRQVFFLGAGVSCAYGLPNTAGLLGELRDHKVRRTPTQTDLVEAYKAFYPDGGKRNYLPDTVDFFASLQAFIDIGAPTLAGAKLTEATKLLRDLKLGIAHLLVDRIRDAEGAGKLEGLGTYLDKIVSPGNVVITTNWDLLVERYAQKKSVDVRRRGLPSNGDLLLLKLHGSIDWCEWENTRAKAKDMIEDFALLTEVSRRLPLDGLTPNDIVRVRVVEHWTRAWQRISGRADEPYLVTMYRGKGPELQALTDVWADAYNALSRASSLDVAGYSLPPDDLEIRTLLRSGLTRGAQKVKVTVRNPTPDVHARVRSHVYPDAVSDYSAIVC